MKSKPPPQHHPSITDINIIIIILLLLLKDSPLQRPSGPPRLYCVFTSWSNSTSLMCSYLSSVVTVPSGKETLAKE